MFCSKPVYDDCRENRITEHTNIGQHISYNRKYECVGLFQTMRRECVGPSQDRRQDLPPRHQRGRGGQRRLETVSRQRSLHQSTQRRGRPDTDLSDVGLRAAVAVDDAKRAAGRRCQRHEGGQFHQHRSSGRCLQSHRAVRRRERSHLHAERAGGHRRHHRPAGHR